MQEITGLVNLFNPIGIIAVSSFFAGVWIPFKKEVIGKILSVLGAIGIIASEVYKFFTWHVMTITEEISLHHSIRFAFSEFYFGLIVSVVMVVAYFIIDMKID